MKVNEHNFNDAGICTKCGNDFLDVESQICDDGEPKAEWGTPGNTALENMPPVMTRAEVDSFRDYDER